jgi:hypothetical protein
MAWIAGALPFCFGGCERDHRTLDGKQFAFAVAARAQRPAGMRGQRGLDHRMANATESVAVGIGRLHEHRIGHALNRRLDRVVA